MSQPKKNLLQWEPTPLAKPFDNILLGKKNFLPFVPSYEKEGKPNMFYLLSNEYQRIWAKERNVWGHQEFPREEKKIFRRRYVLRKKKDPSPKTKLPFLKMKRFQNIPSKADHRRV